MCNTTLTRRVGACPNCVSVTCDAFVERVPLGVDRAVIRYERKLKGVDSFTDFSAMVPEVVRERRASA